jgi:hypothetical protein
MNFRMPGTHATPDNSPRKPQREDVRDVPSLPENRAVPLETLLAYAEKVVAAMAKNRDIRPDEAGEPGCSLRSSGADAEASWLHFTADFSAIGMAVDMPLVVTAYGDENSVKWNFGVTPIATTPRTATPKEAADALNMDVLLDGFRRFVAAESVLFPTALTKDAGEGNGPIRIARNDCTCGECGGTLELTDADDVTLSVECENGHAYDLEHDAFDAGFDYVLEYLARRGRMG